MHKWWLIKPALHDVVHTTLWEYRNFLYLRDCQASDELQARRCTNAAVSCSGSRHLHPSNRGGVLSSQELRPHLPLARRFAEFCEWQHVVIPNEGLAPLSPRGRRFPQVVDKLASYRFEPVYTPVCVLAFSWDSPVSFHLSTENNQIPDTNKQHILHQKHHDISFLLSASNQITRTYGICE